MKTGDKVKIKVNGKWIDAVIDEDGSVNEKFFRTKRKIYFQFDVEGVK